MRRGAAAAIAAGLIAFALYRATLLPGVDFGDTGSFQATVGSPAITPRDGYPLYFALGDLTLWLTRGEPARALNLASALEGGAAVGLFTLAAAELSGSLAAGFVAALLFAGSYTFWSQAIIAEVYALHAVFVSLTLLLILRWQRRPSEARLLAFFAAYAIGFGNHLSMVLLAPGYTLFLLLAAPGGWRSMLTPRVIGLAAACAAVGALQYAWNMRALWVAPIPPHGVADAIGIFWFDVTKADWRATMVMRLPSSMVTERFAMYWFDLRQQFDLVVILLAALGLVDLLARQPRRGGLMAALYAVNVVFAFTYDVGDTHVFYLPSHQLLALLAARGIALGYVALWHRPVRVGALLMVPFAAAQMYRNYPALDRSDDRRPSDLLAGLTQGLDDRRDILLTDLNWQVDNGLAYFVEHTRPEVARAQMPDVLPYLPALVRDNAAIGRDVTSTEAAAAEVRAAYGPLFTVDRDSRVAAPTLADRVEGLPSGTRYVLIVLEPTRGRRIDPGDYGRALALLTGGHGPQQVPGAPYVAIAGRVGAPPTLIREASSPYDLRADVGGTRLEVRMESWLAFDTIRRMGFAQAIAARHHTLIAERGVSFAAFDAAGRPLVTAYAAGIFAPQPRYLIRLSP